MRSLFHEARLAGLALALPLLGGCTLLIGSFAERCEDGFPASCNGQILTVCDQGFVVTRDCGDLICDETAGFCDPCGNGRVDAGEECDDGDRNDGGTCDGDCTLPRCGNGRVSIDENGTVEECDDGANNADSPNACRTNCQLPACGDDIVDFNDLDGDGQFDPGEGEQCDDGTQNSDAIAFACRESCLSAFCGDGVRDFEDLNANSIFDVGEGEECDDGNTVDDDGCNFTPSPEEPTLQCRATFPGCNNGQARETADVDGDGLFDHEVCYNNAQISLSAGDAPVAVADADLNLDGGGDVAVLNTNDDRVGVFLNANNLSGTLGNLGAQNQTFSIDPIGAAQGIDAIALVLADVNNDGKRDILTANQGSNNISVLLNQSVFDTINIPPQNSVFAFADAAVFAAGDSPLALAALDLNKDGNIDVVTVNPNVDTVSILLGAGNGQFAAPQNVSVGDKPVGVILADLNGDTNIDIATVNETARNVSLLFSNGNGSFQNAVAVAVGNGPISISSGDIEGDSDTDLAVANQSDDTVTILLNNGTGAFTAQAPLAVGDKPRAVVLGDINHDPAALDLVVANSGDNTISLLRGKPGATFAPQLVLRVGLQPVALTLGDFEPNSYFDIVTANLLEDRASVLIFTP
jgi:hypothetical protein